MRLRRLPAVLSAVALVAVGVPAFAVAKGGVLPGGKTISAGYGEADATWNVGAAAGQYANDNTSLAENLNPAKPGEVDPYQFSHIKEKSYGIQSRLTVRAIVVEGVDGERVALLKSDNYLAQDLLLRRAGQLLAAKGSKLDHTKILHTASHNHSSPYYTTTSPGVFVFQDVFDQRMFEYQARAIATAVKAAEDSLQPAKMAATSIPFDAVKGNVVGTATADDGTPAGYPRDFGDEEFVVMRFDALEGAAKTGKGKGKGLTKPRGEGGPIAVWANFGQHPESLDGYGLTTSDFLGPLERFVEQETGAPLVFSQGDVGSAEGPYENWQTPKRLEDGTLQAFAHVGYAQMERGSRIMADAVIAGFEQAATDEAQVPFSSDFPVRGVTAWVPGPISQPYPSVGNCRTDPTLAGRPGVGTTPDCTRTPAGPPANPVTSNLDLHGVPIPDEYAAPGYPAVQENTRIMLQVFRFGEVLLASCACEAQVDLILNLESRANAVSGDIFDGFDWRAQSAGGDASEEQGCTPLPNGDWNCPTTKVKTVKKALFDRMLAQVHNDAKGWDDPTYAPYANSEEKDVAKIKGNFTKEELPASRGYALPVGLGHSGDYNGYTVSYREYASRDSYRKALTSYGPHTADYMVTRLVRIAGALKGGAPFALSAEETARATADELRQESLARVIGQASAAAYDGWLAALPDDVGPVAAARQPKDVQRFDAATFQWRGGSNAIDNPAVTVERQVDGAWETFADMTGEVQTQVAFPKGVQGVADTYTGRQEWLWTAGFEAFTATREDIGTTPAGTYRFAVAGQSRKGRTTTPYALTSTPFTVSPWTGVQVTDGAVDESGNASFSVPSSTYPRTYASTFRTIKDDGSKTICRTCAFRPWATTAEAASAVVTVTRVDGMTQQVPATFSDGRWTAPTALQAGEKAVVAAGGVLDANGNTNGAPLVLR